MNLKKEKLIKEFESELARAPRDPDFVIEPLKRPPKYGVFLKWPAEGNDWVHPDDLDMALQLIPSPRVFRRVDCEDGFSIVTYGQDSIRIKPSMWLEIRPEGYEIGDCVEVKSCNGRHEPMIAHIQDVFWDNHERRIEYVLRQEGRVLEKRLTSDDFRMVKSLTGFMNRRQIQMAERGRLQ